MSVKIYDNMLLRRGFNLTKRTHNASVFEHKDGQRITVVTNDKNKAKPHIFSSKRNGPEEKHPDIYKALGDEKVFTEARYVKNYRRKPLHRKLVRKRSILRNSVELMSFKNFINEGEVIDASSKFRAKKQNRLTDLMLDATDRLTKGYGPGKVDFHPDHTVSHYSDEGTQRFHEFDHKTGAIGRLTDLRHKHAKDPNQRPKHVD